MSFWEKLKHAFNVGGEAEELTEREEDLLDKLADGIVRRGMGTPAILFLESFRPLSFIGSQVMVFLKPFIDAMFPSTVYDEFIKIFEKRPGIRRLIELIEEKMGAR